MPSKPSLPSEGWGLGAGIDHVHAESPLRKAVKGDTARKESVCCFISIIDNHIEDSK
jgi:hypothetical protein